MRVNIYAEEMTDRVEIVEKDGFTGVRFYTYLPVTTADGQVAGPFIHREDDDDSGAVTFWGKKKLVLILKRALELLESER